MNKMLLQSWSVLLFAMFVSMTFQAPQKPMKFPKNQYTTQRIAELNYFHLSQLIDQGFIKQQLLHDEQMKEIMKQYFNCIKYYEQKMNAFKEKYIQEMKKKLPIQEKERLKQQFKIKLDKTQFRHGQCLRKQKKELNRRKLEKERQKSIEKKEKVLSWKDKMSQEQTLFLQKNQKQIAKFIKQEQNLFFNLIDLCREHAEQAKKNEKILIQYRTQKKQIFQRISVYLSKINQHLQKKPIHLLLPLGKIKQKEQNLQFYIQKITAQLQQNKFITQQKKIIKNNQMINICEQQIQKISKLIDYFTQIQEKFKQNYKKMISLRLQMPIRTFQQLYFYEKEKEKLQQTYLQSKKQQYFNQFKQIRQIIDKQEKQKAMNQLEYKIRESELHINFLQKFKYFQNQQNKKQKQLQHYRQDEQFCYLVNKLFKIKQIVNKQTKIKNELHDTIHTNNIQFYKFFSKQKQQNKFNQNILRQKVYQCLNDFMKMGKNVQNQAQFLVKQIQNCQQIFRKQKKIREQEMRKKKMREQEMMQQRLREQEKKKKEMREQELRKQEMRKKEIREQKMREQEMRKKEMREQKMREQERMQQRLREQERKKKEMREQEMRKMQQKQNRQKSLSPTYRCKYQFINNKLMVKLQKEEVYEQAFLISTKLRKPIGTRFYLFYGYSIIFREKKEDSGDSKKHKCGYIQQKDRQQVKSLFSPITLDQILIAYHSTSQTIDAKKSFSQQQCERIATLFSRSYFRGLYQLFQHRTLIKVLLNRLLDVWNKECAQQFKCAKIRKIFSVNQNYHYKFLEPITVIQAMLPQQNGGVGSIIPPGIFWSNQKPVFPSQITRQMLNVHFYINEYRPECLKMIFEESYLHISTHFIQLQSAENFINWFFPMAQSQNINNNSKSLTAEQRSYFVMSQQIGTRLYRAYNMMLKYYGLLLIDNKTGRIKLREISDRFVGQERTGQSNLTQKMKEAYLKQKMKETFSARAMLLKKQHQLKRISRMMACLSQTGWAIYAQQLAIFLRNACDLKLAALSSCPHLRAQYQTTWVRYIGTPQQLLAIKNVYLQNIISL